MKLSIVAAAVGLLASSLSAQKYPYPQNLTYPYGNMPATFSTDNFKTWYDQYKKQSNLLKSCDGGIAAMADNGSNVKVEAMGWAIIIAAYMGDKETFDGLYTFYKSKIQQSHGMMSWQTNCGGGGDPGSASDGDLDVAFALLVAAYQWEGSYADEAAKVIGTVEKLITQCEGTSVIVGGYSGTNAYGGCNQTDISYYTPAFFKAFYEFTGNEAWKKLADDTYTVLNNAADDNTGLVPNWHTWKGAQSPQGQYYYGFDACRVPWRMTLDYLWNGNEKAKEWCTTISNWAYKIGPKNIKDGYNLNGSATGSWHSMSYTGGFAVAAMCNTQEISDAFGAEIARMSYDSYWYHAYLGNCYMLAMTGNMWRPGFDTVSVKRVRENRIRNRTLSSAVTVRNIANRELLLTGTGRHHTVGMTTLCGKRVNHSVSYREQGIAIDIASLRSGCYLLSVDDGAAGSREHRIVSIY